MKTKTNLKEFLKDDLIKLDYHTNELIDNLIIRGNDKEFKKDIEETQRILNYWYYHIKNLNLNHEENENFECYLINILDSEELTNKEKIKLIREKI